MGNAAARRRRSGSTPFRGVRKRPSGNYGAVIIIPQHKGRREWLGTFATALEAAIAYDRAARRLGCSEANTNFPNAALEPPPDQSSVAETENRTDRPFQFDLNLPPPTYFD